MNDDCEDGEHKDWGLILPFWIDTDAYTDRDREMFVSGYEFAMLAALVESGESFQKPIHRENESRVRMLCGRRQRQCSITPHEGYDGCETWSELKVEKL
jgi:hypothetical protein